MKNFLTLWMILSIFVFKAVYGVDFHPDTKARLISQGKMEKIIQQYNKARKMGIDNPSGPALDLAKFLSDRSTTMVNGLFILVDFNDHVADTLNHPPAAFDDLLFSTGTHPTGSMNDYYGENSNQKMGITGQITPWLRMPQPYTYYVNGQAGFGNYPHNAQKLVEDAVAAADSLVDFSQFDNDGDGYVDALFVVHSGPGRETTGSDNDIHSHAWAITPQVRDGVIIQRYSMEPEIQGNHLVTIGVFAHEFGHVLGLPDLYDTDYSSAGVGYWSVMAGGSWAGPPGMGGAVPVHFDIWSKQTLGWVTPTQLGMDSMNVFIPPIEGDSAAYRLWKNGNSGPQYFLTEYRKKTGFDSYLRGEGLLIWHIDENVNGNSNDWHRKVDLEQADGLFQLNNPSGSGGNSGDSGDPFPGLTANTSFNGNTTPNSHNYSGEETLVAAMNISDPGNGAYADLYVSFPLPLVELTGLFVNDSLGDNQGDLDPGEHVWLTVELVNSGVQTPNVDITLSSNQNYVSLIDSQTTIPMVPSDTLILKNVFELQVSPGINDPSYVRLVLDMQNTFFAETYPSVFTIGDQPGFASDMENDAWVWTHYALSQGFGDQWTVTQGRNHTPGGARSYKLGQPGIGGHYSPSLHAALETPWLEVSGQMTLEFAAFYDIEASSTPGMAYDGVLLEFTYDGINYFQLTPSEGYTHQIISNPDSPFMPGTSVFSGNSGGWIIYHADLPNNNGPVRIRFVFGSDAYTEGEGFYLDDVALTPSTAIANENQTAVAGKFGILNNYPNPFNPATTIRFRTDQTGPVSLTVYNITGQKVRTLVNKTVQAGVAEARWDGRNDSGKIMGSGIYVVVLRKGQNRSVKKIMLMK